MRRASVLTLLLLVSVPGAASQRAATSEIERAVQEFKIRTRDLGLRADSPRKSSRNGRGKSAFHGRVFWNVRNDFLDAVPHEVRQTGGEQGLLRRNQYGFNVSGPVVIPALFHGGSRTFFSLSYEGMREKIGRTYLSTVPTTPERAGDFGAVVDKSGKLLPIHDPRSTRLNPDFDAAQNVSRSNLQYLRDPFPLNQIPSSVLDPTAQSAIAFYPASNTDIGPFFQNNYFIYSPEINKADGIRAKLDHAVRDRHRVSMGLGYSNGFAGAARLFPTIADPGRADRDSRVRSGSLEHVFTLSPNSLNTFRVVAWMSVSENSIETDERGQPFPVFRFSPYLSMGRSYPVSRTARSYYEVSDGFSTRRGRHRLRVSGEWSREQANSFWPQYPSGRFDFSDGLTSLPGIVNTGHAFASYLLGLARFAETSLVEHPSYFRNNRGNVAVRDEYEVRPGLTLYFGIAVDISTPRVEKFDRQSTVDLHAANSANGRPGALVAAARGGQGRAFQPNRFRPEPSLSLAWNPRGDTRTVVRLSWRRSYSPIPLYSGQWGTQGFNGNPTCISPNAQLEPAVILLDGLPPPAYPLPDLRPEAVNDTIADLIVPTSRQPIRNYASLSVQREIPASIVLTIGANHSRGRSMLAGNDGANPNAIPLDALEHRDLLNEEEFNRSLRPYPQYQRFDVHSSYPIGTYERDEGYLRMEKRTSKGLSLRATYEFSKQMDDYSGPDGLQDYYNRENEWTLAAQNDPHRVSLSYMYELPFGPNRSFLNSADWRRHLVEGWSVSGTTTYSSGDPIALEADFNNTGNVVRTLYVNSVPEVDPHVEDPGPENWFNADAFVNPPDFTIGHVSRTHPTLRNPSRQNHDLSVTKRFALAADRALEFSAVGFNFINHANWNNPDTEIGSETAPNVNAGRIIGSRGGRVIQLGLRFSF